MQYTQEQIDDIASRSDQANQEIKEVLEKLQFETRGIPIYIDAGNGSFLTSIEVRLVDTKFSPQPSPDQPGEANA